jgi:hypothetical protein
MVKLHCDRCGEEIKNRYYTINFNSFDVDLKDSTDSTIDCSLSSAITYSNARNSVLKMLNSQKMYCEHCRSEIEKFINSKE